MYVTFCKILLSGRRSGNFCLKTLDSYSVCKLFFCSKSVPAREQKYLLHSVSVKVMKKYYCAVLGTTLSLVIFDAYHDLFQGTSNSVGYHILCRENLDCKEMAANLPLVATILNTNCVLVLYQVASFNIEVW